MMTTSEVSIAEMVCGLTKCILRLNLDDNVQRLMLHDHGMGGVIKTAPKATARSARQESTNALMHSISQPEMIKCVIL